MARYISQRGVLVIGALICLCLSDSVGPRLLPLPALSKVEGFERLKCETRASRTPNPSRDSKRRIEIMVGSQYRPGDSHSEPQAADLTHRTSLASVAVLYRITFVGSTFYKASPVLSEPSGRGPPHLST